MDKLVNVHALICNAICKDSVMPAARSLCEVASRKLSKTVTDHVGYSSQASAVALACQPHVSCYLKPWMPAKSMLA